MIKKLLFCFSLLSICFVQAQTFTVDGINYEVISGTQVKVIASSASGDLVLPETVNNSSIDYTVTLIDNGAFSDEFGITSVVIPNSVTSIGNNAFDGCFSMTSVDLGDGAISIGDFAFQSCGVLASVVLPDLLETIGEGAFQYCLGLTSLIIPNSVITIGDSSFFGCSGLTALTIGESVTAIGENAFGKASLNSTDLTSVICAIATPLVINANVFNNRNIGSCSLTVASGSLTAYQTALVWKDFNPILGTLSVENIGLQDELSFYPNPTQNKLFVEVKNINNAKLEVYDVNGKSLFNQSLKRSTNTIDTKSLSTGIYFFKVSSDEGSISKRIVKN